MLKEIREFYGISQKTLAEFIGISRSRLSMAECRRRDIPGRESLNLLKFFQAIDNAVLSEEVQMVCQNQQQKREENIASSLKAKRDDLEYYDLILEKMKKEQMRTSDVLNCLSFLKKSASTLEISFIKVLENSALKIQRETATDKQLILELRIKALEAEILYLERLA